MPGDAGDRTEDPTPKRRQEARKEGRVARSQDLTASVGLVAGLVLLNIFGPTMLEKMLGLTREIGDGDLWLSSDIKSSVIRAGWAVLAMLGPFLAALLVLTSLGVLSQFGLLITPSKLQPKLSNISPAKGLKNICSKDSVTRLAMGIVKMGIVTWIAYATIKKQLGPVLAAGGLHSWGILGVAGEVVFALSLRLAIALLVLGILDYFWQRYSLEQSLKMTKQEVKDEMKNMDGDPQVKRRQREVQMRVAMQRINTDVPQADVVVTNPTHYSVALKYDSETMEAPRVVAKGKDFLAFRIRQVAQTHGVPIVERPPLARALFAQVDPGKDIPSELYKAVAEVLAYVYRLSKRGVKAS